MGTSTDAILVYGVPLDEGDLPWKTDDGEGDWEDWLLRLAGFTETNWRVNGYWERKRAALAAFPFDIVPHCSCDYPMYILTIRGTATTANRGFPEKIEALEPKDPSELLAFCAEHGMKHGEPGWWLCSMWC